MAGDRFLVYVSGGRGKETGCIIAAGEVEAAPRPTSHSNARSEQWVGVLWKPAAEVPIRLTEWFESVVVLRPLVAHMRFIKNKRYWGNSLQGSIARISAQDFELLVRTGRSV
jgi:hypothetical protein